MGEMDEISERIGGLTRDIKTMQRNQEKMLVALGGLTVNLAVHCEREAAYEERLAKVESRKPDLSLYKIVSYPVFWVAISIIGGLIAVILGVQTPFI